MEVDRLSAPVRRPYRAAVRRWERHELARRMWAADPTVWASDPSTPELADRLGWLNLHETMAAEAGEITLLADEIRSEGPAHVVLCGMGGSSLAPEVYGAVLTGDGPELIVVDSTHPEAMQRVIDRIDPGRSIFLVSSKSGTTLETLSAFRILWQLAGGEGRRFVAITDPGSPLEDLGRDRGFRAVVNAPADVGGRFSALTPFGLVPAAILGVDVDALLASAAEFAREANGEAEHDPGIPLGLVWATLALGGMDKLTFVTSRSLAAFPAWMEQLIAESLGKDGTGIVPVAEEPTLDRYSKDRAFVSYALAGEEAPSVDRLTSHPTITIELPDRLSIAAEMLRAEVATAAAGEVLGVHPFDQPNVEAAKRLAKQAMAGELDVAAGEPLSPKEAVAELSRLLSEARAGDYVGIQAFLPPGGELADEIRRLRSTVSEQSGLATTFGWGPRFLHSTGQLHKGGPNRGIFIQLVDRPTDDVAVPETDHTLGQIIAAQAAGDHQALVAEGRRVVRVELGADRLSGLRALTKGLA